MDIDGELRPGPPVNGTTTPEAGCDEWQDTNGDGIPDWYVELLVRLFPNTGLSVHTTEIAERPLWGGNGPTVQEIFNAELNPAGGNPAVRDSDGDTVSDFRETQIGTNYNSRDSDRDGTEDYDLATLADPMADTDKDTIRNRDDSVPYDAKIRWPKSPESGYAVFRMPPFPGQTTVPPAIGPVFINDNGRIAYLSKIQVGELLKERIVTWQIGEPYPQAIIPSGRNVRICGISSEFILFSERNSYNPAGRPPVGSPGISELYDYDEYSFWRWGSTSTYPILEVPLDDCPSVPGWYDTIQPEDQPGLIQPVNGFNYYRTIWGNTTLTQNGTVFLDSITGMADNWNEPAAPWPHNLKGDLYTDASCDGIMLPPDGDWDLTYASQYYWGSGEFIPLGQMANGRYSAHFYYPSNFGGIDDPTYYHAGFRGISKKGSTYAALRHLVISDDYNEIYMHHYKYRWLSGNQTKLWSGRNPATGNTGDQIDGVSVDDILPYMLGQNDWVGDPMPTADPRGFRLAYRPASLSCTNSRLLFRVSDGSWTTTLMRNYASGLAQYPSAGGISGLWWWPSSTMHIVNNRGELLCDGGRSIWRNGHATPLPCQAATAINDNGLIAGLVGGGVAGMLPAVLLPVEIVPDHNRDGKIDSADRGIVTDNNPWRWWINDDDDSPIQPGAPDIFMPSDDTPGSPFADCEDGLLGPPGESRIDGISDLADFFPVWLNLKPLLDYLPNTGGDAFRFAISHSGGLRFCETDLTTADSRAFITDPVTVNELSTALVSRPRSNSALLSVSLTPDFVADCRIDPSRGIILIEGCNATSEPLELTIWKGDIRVASVFFPLSISPVEDMYRWLNVRGIDSFRPGPISGGSIAHPLATPLRESRISEPPNRPDCLTNDKHCVMVHGYNVSENASRGWGAEVFKRLYQFGSNAKFTMLSWQSDTSSILNGTLTPDYWENCANAFNTSDSLKQKISILPGEKILIAHSLGNMVVCSAIVDRGLKVEKYFMLDAAVPLEAFDRTADNSQTMRNPEWANYDSRYWSANWHRLFVPSDRRSSYSWRGRFGNIPNAYNFYSSGEEVLQNADGTWPNAGVLRAWTYQEMGKGRKDILAALFESVYQDVGGGWGFNQFWRVGYPNDVVGEVYRNRTPDEVLTDIPLTQSRWHPLFIPFHLSNLHDDDVGENFANQYWVRSRTLAVDIPALSWAAGSNSVPVFGINRNIDLMPSGGKPGMKHDWPTSAPSRGYGNRWLHSDAKDIALRYNHPLYEYWIQLGELN